MIILSMLVATVSVDKVDWDIVAASGDTRRMAVSHTNNKKYKSSLKEIIDRVRKENNIK